MSTSTNLDTDIDTELDKLGEKMGEFTATDLAVQLTQLPPKAQAQVFDPDVSRKLSSLASPKLQKEQVSKDEGRSKKEKKQEKMEAPLRKLSEAAIKAEDSREESVLHAELDELERLSQLSERNAIEIENLKRMIAQHESLLARQEKDIALLLSANTELKKEISMIKAQAQPVVEQSYGSRLGHFSPSSSETDSKGSREVKATDVVTPSVQPNPAVGKAVSSSQVKKRLVL